MLLADKVVVVCGIGPGLGQAIALQSARAGADVVLRDFLNAALLKRPHRLEEVHGSVGCQN